MPDETLPDTPLPDSAADADASMSSTDVSTQTGGLDTDSLISDDVFDEDAATASGTTSGGAHPERDRRRSETCPGFSSRWLPFEWLREPELFFLDWRPVKRGKRSRGDQLVRLVVFSRSPQTRKGFR